MATFTEAQKNTIKIVWAILKQEGYNDQSAAGVIGNLHAESEMDPQKNELSGGGGYGLGQWTPKSNLYSQAAALGISNATAETAEGQARIIAKGDVTGQWSVAGNTQYHSSVRASLYLSDFKLMTDLTATAANFCAHWERPSVSQARMSVRIDAANSVYQLQKGQGSLTNKGGIEMQALITIGQGSKKGISWFDGQKRHNLPDADCATILNEIYHKNTGKYMPNIDLSGSKEAWLVRLDQAINAGS